MIKRFAWAALAAAVLGGGVAACGYRGDLERPAPILWEDRTDYEAKEKAKKEAEEKAKQQPTNPPAPPKG